MAKGQPRMHQDALALAHGILDDPALGFELRGPRALPERSIFSRLGQSLRGALLGLPLGALTFCALIYPFFPQAPDSASAPPPNATDALIEELAERPARTKNELARKAAGVDTFLGLATMVEGFNPRPYFDTGGLNIGMGYCISARSRAFGIPHVSAELQSVGLRPEMALALAKAQPWAIRDASLTQAQALRLLAITKSHYERKAIKALGPKSFDALPEHQQGALSYLSYNSSDISRFKKLISATRQGKSALAGKELTPSYRDQNGAWRRNWRLGAWAQAAWESSERLDHGLANPGAFEREAKARELSRVALLALPKRKPSAPGAPGAKAPKSLKAAQAPQPTPALKKPKP